MSVTAERLMVEVQADVRQALSQLDRVDNQTAKSSSRMGKMAKGMAAGFSGAAVVGGIGKAIGLAKSFDLTMRQVGVQTGQTGGQLKGLGDLAMKMGADTAFSAQDASDAMLELAKGGLSAAEIKAGALKTTMTLAAAGGLEMGSAAGYVTQAMNTFGIEAGKADSVAVALAGGANASTASVESLGQALSQVGPGASNAGMSIQETVAALSAFDNAGIKGSDAGTSLKTMLTSLVPTTTKAKEAMAKYGLEMVNADGSFKSMGEVAQELKDGLGNLSDAEQTRALKTIFGSDATRAATVLMKEGKKGVDEYVKATKNQETVQKMANTAMGGAEGAWNELTGSLETLAIKLGSALLPAFSKAAKGASGFINFLGGLGDELAASFDWIKGFVSGFLTPFAPLLAPLKGLFSGAAGGASALGSALAPVGRFIAAHSKAFGVAAGIITAVFLPAMAAAATAATVAKVKVVAAFLAKTAAAVKHAAMVGPSLVKAGIFYVQYAAVTTASLAKAAASHVANGAKMVASMAATAARTAASWAMMAARALASAARMAASWVIAMGPVGWAIAAAVAVAVAIYKNWDKIKAVTQKVFGWVGDFVKKVWSGIKSAVSATVNAIKGVVVAVWNAIKAGVSKAVNGVKAVISVVFGAIKTVITNNVNAWKAVITAVWNGIKAVISGVVNAVKGLIKGWSFISGFIGGLFQKAKTLASNALTGMVNFIKGIPGKVKAVFSSAGSWLLNAGKDIIQGLLDGIGNMIGSVKSKLGELTNLIPDWKGPRSKDKKLLTPAGKAIMESLMEGFQGKFPAIQRQLEGLTERIEKTYDAAAERVNSKANAAIAQAQKKLKNQAEASALTRIRKNRDAKLGRLSAEKKRLLEAAKVYEERLEAFKGVVDSMADGFGDTWEDAQKQMKEVRRGVAEAFTGRTQTVWLSNIDTMNDRLRAAYATRESLVSQMEDAQKRLDDLNQAKSDFVGNVFSGMAGQANVTNAGDSADVIAASLGDQVAKVQKFAGILGQLRAKGFSDAVVMQVASAGVEGGWQAANALIAANSTQVSSINTSMAAITSQATATAAALGSQMYDAGIAGATSTLQGVQSQYAAVTASITTMGDQLSAALQAALTAGLNQGGVEAARGLARGLEGERKALRRLAKNIGDEIGDELRKALKVKSPSRVTMAIGRFVGMGLAKGIQAQVKGVKASAAVLGRSAVPTVPKLTAAQTYAASQPTLAGLQGGQKAGAPVTFQFNTYNPVTEPQSRTTNKALDRAGSLGLV